MLNTSQIVPLWGALTALKDASLINLTADHPCDLILAINSQQ